MAGAKWGDMLEISWIFISYILGAVPYGYIFSRLSGKNPLEVGWRKTSGTNILKNVGKWQGVATIICDIGKGYAVVYIAQLLDFSFTVQALAGAAAVGGHNWSIFLHRVHSRRQGLQHNLFRLL